MERQFYKGQVTKRIEKTVRIGPEGESVVLLIKKPYRNLTGCHGHGPENEPC